MFLTSSKTLLMKTFEHGRWNTSMTSRGTNERTRIPGSDPEIDMKFRFLVRSSKMEGAMTHRTSRRASDSVILTAE